MKTFSKFFFAGLLLTVTSASWALDTLTIGEWGMAHYNKFGKSAGRNLPPNGDYGDYVISYTDLRVAYTAYVERGGLSMEEWGMAHYNKFGKSAGRNLPSNGDYGDYARSYSDLLIAYHRRVTSLNYEESFRNCSYVKSRLTCSGALSGSLSCGLVGKSTVTCAIEGVYRERFNTCALVGRELACSGSRDGYVICRLIGETVLCNYKSG